MIASWSIFKKLPEFHNRILDRDMLIYLMWQSGQIGNVQIAEKFGLTYSAVSRRVKVFKNLLSKNKTLQNKFAELNH